MEKKTQRQISALMREIGCKLISTTTNRHIKAVIERPNGTRFKYVFAVSPGDCRDYKNTLSELRRYVDAEG